jgi:hypothetical protein
MRCPTNRWRAVVVMTLVAGCGMTAGEPEDVGTARNLLVVSAPDAATSASVPAGPVSESDAATPSGVPAGYVYASLWTAVTAPLDGPKGFPFGTPCRPGPCSSSPLCKTYSPSPFLPGNRVAAWVVEQPQNQGALGIWEFIAGDGETDKGQSINTFVVPMARYGTVFFADAVCGAWSQRPQLQPWVFPTEGPKTAGFTLHYPSEAPGLVGSPSGAPAIVTDGLWSEVVGQTVNVPKNFPLPPLGLANQAGLGNFHLSGLPNNWPGIAISAGQLVSHDVTGDIVMCKYVYPGV